MAAVALVLLVAAPTLLAGSAPPKRQLGCYWYPREARAPVTNRSLSSLPAGTCDYVDIAGACLLVLDAQGRLAWAQRQGPAGHSATGTCAELAGRTATDARGARRVSPSVQFFWQVGGTQADMMAVFNSSAKRATAVSELRRFQRLYPDVVNGFAFDYEYHYDTVPPDPHFCVGTPCLGAVKRGLTAFLRSLKAATGRGVHWWTGGLTGFANTCDVAAIQPYVEVVELAAYWTPDPFNLTGAARWKSVDELGFRTPNPNIMNPNDTQILRAPPYSYTSEQLMVGAGLSSFSYLDVPKAVLPICACESPSHDYSQPVSLPAQPLATLYSLLVVVDDKRAHCICTCRHWLPRLQLTHMQHLRISSRGRQRPTLTQQHRCVWDHWPQLGDDRGRRCQRPCQADDEHR
jgi:hypothetical protein